MRKVRTERVIGRLEDKTAMHPAAPVPMPENVVADQLTVPNRQFISVRRASERTVRVH